MNITKEQHINTVENSFPQKKILHTYQNENHFTSILEDGTRIRETIDDQDTRFSFVFPENADVKITNYCNAGCKFCHEGSSIEGKHADLKSMMTLWDSWIPGTEIAIGGGNALAHPDIDWFVQYLSERGVICNITINQKHIFDYYQMLIRFIENNYVHGIGVSLTDSSKTSDLHVIKHLSRYSNQNVVIHTIAGILSEKDISALKDRKVLILGYKDNVGRGVSYHKEHKNQIDENIKWLSENLKDISKTVSVLSFDNLALKQLDVKRSLGISQEEWDLRFQGKDYGDPNGEDAPSTFYLDAVNKTIGRSSTQPYNERVSYINQTFEEAFKDSLSNYKINEGEYGELKTLKD